MPQGEQPTWAPRLQEEPERQTDPWRRGRLGFAFLATLLWTLPAGAQDPPGAPASQPPAADSAEASSRRVSVEPPRLLHFERADYPPDAERSGLEAVVELALVIDATGKVTRVEVRQPAGHGFDEAAAAAAQRFMFEPARRDGVPVAVRILYRYRFELAPRKAASQEEKQPAAPRPGELRGRIVAGTPPTPLAGVELQIRAPGKEPFATRTADDGTWVLSSLPPGDYVVEVNAIGYRRGSQLESVREGTVTRVEYGLEFSDELPLEITVRGRALRREVTHYELPRDELQRIPGTMGDAIHAVEALPSVGRPRGLSGQLLVRGSDPRDTHVYVEGTLVPHVFHYGSLSSVVPGEMVERIEFFPSNFTVRYGRGMGGVVEVRLRETNPDNELHGSAQIDMINARLNVEGPVPAMPGWSFMSGFRTSYLDRWLVPMLRSQSSAKDAMPRYHDYQLYLQRRLPDNGVYRIGLIGAYDTYVPIEDDPEWHNSTDRFWHLQSQLRWPISSAVELKASGSLGKTRSHNGDDDVRWYERSEALGILRSELSLETGSLGIARVGTDLLYAPFTVEALTDRRSAGGELSSDAMDALDLERYDISGITLQPAAYVEYELSPHRRVDVTLGIRGDYTKATRQVDIAPRLAARYVLVEPPMSSVLKGGVGLFYQPPPPEATVPELGTNGLSSSRAVHSMLGFEQALSGQVTLSAEGFWKELRELLHERQDGSGRLITENSGRGRVLGTDLLLRYASDERFFGWIAYTLSRSTREPGPDEPEQLYRYDQTHVLNLLGNVTLGRGWEAGARFRIMTGFPYHDCYGGLFDNASGSYLCYGPLEQKRLGPFHQLDLRLQKSWTLGDLRLAAYLDLINAYHHDSPDKMVPNYDYSKASPLSLSMPLLPSVGVRGEL